MKRFIAPPSFCFTESSNGIVCFFSFHVAPPDGRMSVVTLGTASRVGVSIMPSWQLALFSVMPSGVPRVLVTGQCFVPGLPRCVGLGPTSASFCRQAGAVECRTAPVQHPCIMQTPQQRPVQPDLHPAVCHSPRRRQHHVLPRPRSGSASACQAGKAAANAISRSSPPQPSDVMAGCSLFRSLGSRA